EGRAFYQYSRKKTKGKETHQLDKIGQKKIQIGKNDGGFVVIRINKSQHQGYDKDKDGGNKGKGNDRQKFGPDELFFGKTVDQVLFNGFITVFIGHHGYDNNGQEQLKKSGDIGVEMPDIGKIKYPLLGQMELDGADIEFYGSYQGNTGEQNKISNDQYLAGPAVPKFYEFYLKETLHWCFFD